MRHGKSGLVHIIWVAADATAAAGVSAPDGHHHRPSDGFPIRRTCSLHYAAVRKRRSAQIAAHLGRGDEPPEVRLCGSKNKHPDDVEWTTAPQTGGGNWAFFRLRSPREIIGRIEQ